MFKKNIIILIFLLSNVSFSQIIPSLSAKPKEVKSEPPLKIKKEIITVYKEKESNRAIIKFLCDADAVLYIDAEKKGNLKKDIPFRVAIAKGEYVVKVVSSENQNDYVRFNYLISEIGVEKLEEINLQAVINKRLPIKQIEMIKVGAFSIGKYEVTQELWQAVMESNPSQHKGCGTCPVENVSWNDVQVFIKKLNSITGKNYRLPTSDEWVYAAKGGALTHNYVFAGSNDIDSVGWYKDNSNGQTHPVGQKQSNELGIYDMSGNVWEWCSDLMPYDNRFPEMRVEHGYCWSSWKGNYFFSPGGYEPDGNSYQTGFRLASP